MSFEFPRFLPWDTFQTAAKESGAREQGSEGGETGIAFQLLSRVQFGAGSRGGGSCTEESLQKLRKGFP